MVKVLNGQKGQGMLGRLRSRFVSVSALVVLTGALAPAFAFGSSHETSGPVTGDAAYVLLQLGAQDRVIFGSDTQPISTHKNRCNVVSFDSPQILVPTAFGGVLGHVSDSLGVQSQGDGNGEPCARVEASDGEAISLKLGSHMASYSMTAVDVDLELKGNAVVEVSYLNHGTVVHTHIFDPSSPNDDGPDSGDLDNWRYFHRPMDDGTQILFDEVKFTPTNGILSVEGGSDGTENGSLVPSNNYSQFEVVQSYDGEITCGDMAPIAEDGMDTSGVVTMHTENKGAGWILEPACDLKPYNAWVTDDALAFVPDLEGTEARYTLDVEVRNQAIVVESDGTISSLKALYDPAPSFAFPSESADLPLPACLDQPILTGPGYDAFWTQADVGLLPDGASACWYRVTVRPTGDDIGTESWGIYFEDDPGLTFK